MQNSGAAMRPCHPETAWKCMFESKTKFCWDSIKEIAKLLLEALFIYTVMQGHQTKIDSLWRIHKQADTATFKAEFIYGLSYLKLNR